MLSGSNIYDIAPRDHRFQKRIQYIYTHLLLQMQETTSSELLNIIRYDIKYAQCVLLCTISPLIICKRVEDTISLQCQMIIKKE